jgi:carboxymethylenebutenolidase
VADQTVPVVTSDGEMTAHVWLPEGGTGPGILLLQEIFGISDYVQARARDLADLGYVVLAPEIFWRTGTTKVENGPDALEQAMALVQQVDWETAVQDGVAALGTLREHPAVSGGVGTVGFCYGGGLAFHVAALDDVDVLVSYYGSAIPGLLELAPDVRAPALYHFGLADGYIDQATVERVREAVTGQPDVAFETYPGADHAFDNPDFHLHHPEASRQAWDRTTGFLASRLPVG